MDTLSALEARGAESEARELRARIAGPVKPNGADEP